MGFIEVVDFDVSKKTDQDCILSISPSFIGRVEKLRDGVAVTMLDGATVRAAVEYEAFMGMIKDARSA